MLALADVHAYYGESHILHGMTLTVETGEVATLVGRNGVGKTTTLRAITGIVPPRRGTIELDGVSLVGRASDRIARLGVGYVPEGRRVFANLTVEDNLKVPQGDSGPFTIPRIYELFPRLEERRLNRGDTARRG